MPRVVSRSGVVLAGCLAGLMALPGFALAGAAPQPSPEATVKAFLHYADAEKTLVNYGRATAPMRALFTTGLVADWENAMTYNAVEPVLDADIFDGQQGVAGMKLVRVWTEVRTGGTALVGATLSGVGDDKLVKAHDQLFVLVWQSGAWKVDDIVYLARQDPPDTLDGVLRRTITEHAPR